MWLGLLSWLSAGVAAGLLSARLLPGRPALLRLPAILIGVGGAVTGGMLATWLDFGGLAGFDLRAFICAALASLAALLGWRTVNLAD